MQKKIPGRKKTDLSVFLLTLGCVLIPMEIIFLTAWLQYVRIQEAQYIKEKEQQAAFLTQDIDKEFSHIDDLANELLREYWLTQYVNHIDLYKDSFDLGRRKEIITQLQSKVKNVAFIREAMVLIPSKDTVVTTNGWMKFSDMRDYYKNISFQKLLDTEEYLPYLSDSLVTSSKKTEKVITYANYFLSDSKCCVAFLIDLPLLQTTIERLAAGQFSQIRLLTESQKNPPANPDVLTINQNLNSWPATLFFAYPTYQIAYDTESVSEFWLVGFFMMVLGILGAVFLSRFFSAPLQRILESLGRKEMSLRKGYDYLQNYLTTIERENHALSQTIDRYRQYAKSEIILQLLTDPNADSGTEEICSTIPWLHKGYAFRILLFTGFPQNDSQKLWEDVLKGYYRHFHMFHLLNCNCGAVVWYEAFRQDSEDFHREQLAKSLESGYVAVSCSHTDPSLLHESYLEVQQKLRRHMQSLEPENPLIPLDFESKFITALESSQSDECCRLLSQFRTGQGSPQGLLHIAKLLQKLSSEYEIDIPQISELLDQNSIWNQLSDYCVRICDLMHQEKHQNAAEVAVQVKEYLDANYTNPDISLRLLSDVFSIEATALSKMFKRQFSVNFSDYLQQLRMDAAKALLESNADSVAANSQSVGYLNYLSFKRAFVRNFGLSPKEYRSQVSNVN